MVESVHAGDRRVHVVSDVARVTWKLPRLWRGDVPTMTPTSNVMFPSPLTAATSATLSWSWEYHSSDEKVPPGRVMAVSVVSCQLPELTYRNA